MNRKHPTSRHELSRFADRVLLRTRSGTGVAVYLHVDGSWGFLPRPDDLAVSRTEPGRVSFSIPCSKCRTRFTVCTTIENRRVATPCACTLSLEMPSPALHLDRVFDPPEIDLDFFTASVCDEVARLSGFGLHGMIRGFLHHYWPTMGRRPSAAVWARFYLHASQKGKVNRS
jgi:hypothetical protein